jgi:hypothetical protein
MHGQAAKPPREKFFIEFNQNVEGIFILGAFPEIKKRAREQQKKLIDKTRTSSSKVSEEPREKGNTEKKLLR